MIDYNTCCPFLTVRDTTTTCHAIYAVSLYVDKESEREGDGEGEIIIARLV